MAVVLGLNGLPPVLHTATPDLVERTPYANMHLPLREMGEIVIYNAQSAGVIMPKNWGWYLSDIKTETGKIVSLGNGDTLIIVCVFEKYEEGVSDALWKPLTSAEEGTFITTVWVQDHGCCMLRP